jgi:hypothetical protein
MKPDYTGLLILMKKYMPKHKTNHTEAMEQITFLNWLKNNYYDFWLVAIHIKNEGKRTMNQIQAEKAKGFKTGASDIIIPGSPSFLCEMKATKNKKGATKQQQEYIKNAENIGAFACVAYGHEAAIDAFYDYIKQTEKEEKND